MRRALALLVLAAALSACKDKPASAPGPGAAADRPPPMSAPERQRGTDACATYVQRLCACAKTRPALAETCELKHAKPEALTLAFSVAEDPASTRDSIVRAQKEARKIIKLCIEEAAALPSQGCP